MARTFRAVSLALWFAAAACSPAGTGDGAGANEELPPEPEASGDEAWSSHDITCSGEEQCAADEACVDGVCQMERCTKGPYESAPPIGQKQRFFQDRELIAVGAGAVDGYAPGGADVSYAQTSWDFGANEVLDIDGGQVTGAPAERVVAAVRGTTAVHVSGDGGAAQALEVGFEPVAVATGDVDLDGIDEIAALSGDRRFALCSADESGCLTRELQDDFTGWDVTAGDVDGDGYAEVVFIAGLGGNPRLILWNPHHEQTGETPRLRFTPKTGYPQIDAGDVDGDGTAELVGMNQSGPAGVLADKLHVYTWGGEALRFVSGRKVGAKTADLMVADLDMDDRAEIVVLRGGSEAAVFRADDTLSVSRAFSGNLGTTSSPRKIASVDLDGDSPTAELIEGPQLVPGPVVPTMALSFPPYVGGDDRTGTSKISVGEAERTTESYTDSVSLSVGVEFGVEAGIDGVLAGSVKTKVATKVQKTEGLKKRTKIGTRFSISAQPEVHGDSYGVVLLSSGCFHAYTYRIDDPGDRVGGHDGRLVGLVPVDGRTTVWSTQRFNQLAEALGTLPTIDVTTKLGDPASYPRSPARLDGSPVAPEDMVFPEPPELLVSDVGDVGWKLSNSEYRSQKVAMTASVDVAASTNVAGVDVAGSIGVGAATSYGITVGEQVVFGGKVPPVFDDSSTDHDEYVANRFAFIPYVYKQAYTDADGEPAAYYVMNYAVGE